MVRSQELRRLMGIHSSAARMGITPQEYMDRLAAGELRCSGCKTFHPREAFGNCRDRPSGKNGICLAFQATLREKHREKSKEYFKARYARVQESKPRDRSLVSINEISDNDICYLSGLIDGEGCFTISIVGKQKRHLPIITIAMTHEGVMNWLADLMGAPKTTVIRSNPNPHHAIQYRVQINGKRAIRLAERCLPWLKVKNKQAAIFLEFRKTYIKQRGPGSKVPAEVTAAREAMRQEIKLYNKKGFKDKDYQYIQIFPTHEDKNYER